MSRGTQRVASEWKKASTLRRVTVVAATVAAFCMIVLGITSDSIGSWVRETSPFPVLISLTGSILLIRYAQRRSRR